MEPNILTVTMNPAVDKTISVEEFITGRLNRIKSVRVDPGGKGINVSKAISTYGISQTAIGILAGNHGKQILSMLRQYSFRKDFLMVKGETRVNLKIRDMKTSTITEVNEPGQTVRSEDLEAFFRRMKKHLQKSNLVVISGSLPAGITDCFYTACIQMSAQFHARVIFDADGGALNIGVQAKPFAIKPNLGELERLTGKLLDSDDKVKMEAERLVRSGIKLILVSMGEKGAILHYQDKTYRTYPLPIEVKSTVGAGDAMVAALAYCLQKDLPVDEMARITTAAGCLTAACEGSEMAGWEEIKKVYQNVTIKEL